MKDDQLGVNIIQPNITNISFENHWKSLDWFMSDLPMAAPGGGWGGSRGFTSAMGLGFWCWEAWWGSDQLCWTLRWLLRMPAMQGASHEVFDNIGCFLLCNSITDPAIDFSSVMRSDLEAILTPLQLLVWNPFRFALTISAQRLPSFSNWCHLEGIAKDEKGMDQPQALVGAERDETWSEGFSSLSSCSKAEPPRSCDSLLRQFDDLGFQLFQSWFFLILTTLAGQRCQRQRGRRGGFGSFGWIPEEVCFSVQIWNEWTFQWFPNIKTPKWKSALHNKGKLSKSSLAHSQVRRLPGDGSGIGARAPREKRHGFTQTFFSFPYEEDTPQSLLYIFIYNYIKYVDLFFSHWEKSTRAIVCLRWLKFLYRFDCNVLNDFQPYSEYSRSKRYIVTLHCQSLTL